MWIRSGPVGRGNAKGWPDYEGTRDGAAPFENAQGMALSPWKCSRDGSDPLENDRGMALGSFCALEFISEEDYISRTTIVDKAYLCA